MPHLPPIVSRCRIFGAMPCNTPGETLTVQNCIITPTREFNSGLAAERQAYGTLNFSFNTIDLRNVPGSSGQPEGGIFYRQGSNFNLTFRNNVFIVGGSQAFTLIQDGTSADTLNLSRNVYVLGTNSEIADNYNDGSTTADRTFSQWQALGFDAASVSTSDAKLAADYKPRAGSSVIDIGHDLGPLEDYSGTVFTVRNDAGAYE